MEQICLGEKIRFKTWIGIWLKNWVSPMSGVRTVAMKNIDVELRCRCAICLLRSRSYVDYQSINPTIIYLVVTHAVTLLRDAGNCLQKRSLTDRERKA